LFNTDRYNNFLLNSFYNKRVALNYLSMFLNSIRKKYYVNKFSKNLYAFNKTFNNFSNSYNAILNNKKLFELPVFLKKAYEDYLEIKMFFFDRLEYNKLNLNDIEFKLYPVQLYFFSFINLLFILYFFKKFIKNKNYNIKYYVSKHNYLKKIRLRDKKVELTALHLFTFISIFYKYFFLVKYLLKNNLIDRYQQKIEQRQKINKNLYRIKTLYKNRFIINGNFFFNYIIALEFVKFLKKFKFKKITSFLTTDRTRNIYFFYFNDINSYYHTYFPNVVALKNKLFSIKRFNMYRTSFLPPELNQTFLFFVNKTKKMKFFDDNSGVLYGYKFHFVGRFTRKQKSANL
jgi:hypothetical protein